MQPIATLMQALSSPDDYIFEWRNGELYIERKVETRAISRAPPQTHIARNTSTARA